MTDQFTANALSNGDDGKKWLESIPSIVASCEKKWLLQISPPFNLSYNYVAPAIRTDGTQVVLKIGFPKDREFKTEIKALEVFNGEGIAKLLEMDAENSAILIEQVLPGKPLSQMTDDDEATRIIAGVMKKLWKPLPKNHSFITVKDWSSELFDYHKDSSNENGPIPMKLIEKATRLFSELLESADEPVLVHGDLHHDNIMSSQRDGWLAIDPKGIAAEPAYEVAAMIRNPYEKLKNIVDLRPLLSCRLKILSEDLGLDSSRVWKWCFAQTVLSAVWNVNSSKGADHCVRVAEALSKIE